MLNNTLKKYPVKSTHKYVNTVSSIPEHEEVTYSCHFSSWDTQHHISVRCVWKAVLFLALLPGLHGIYMVRHRQRQAYILAFMSSISQVYFIIFCCVQMDNIGKLQSYLGQSSPSKTYWFPQWALVWASSYYKKHLYGEGHWALDLWKGSELRCSLSFHKNMFLIYFPHQHTYSSNLDLGNWRNTSMLLLWI